MNIFSWGDALFQLFLVAIVIFLVYLLLSIVKSFKVRKQQLDRLEKKMDELTANVKVSDE